MFLGGSVLSFFELLDLLVYNGLVKLTTRRRKKPESNPKISPQVIHVKSADSVV